MAPHKADQAIVIILDIGKNATTIDEKGEESFFNQAKQFTKCLINRKIMSQGNTLISLITLGSKETQNNLAQECEGAFKHIALHSELQTPNWAMIRSIPESGTKSKGDWLDALIVAADHIKNGISGVKLSNKKIVLLTNFRTPSHFSVDIEKLLEGFKDENLEVDVIGPDIYDESHVSKDILAARRFVEETNGSTTTFNFAMQYLLFNKKKSVKPTPWNVDLSIGPNIKIPVSSYIRIKDEPTIKRWFKAVRDPVTSTASASDSIKKETVHINTDNQSVVKDDQIIKGYFYGQKVIPFSDCDRDLLYKSGEKCLSIYGFTHIDNIQWQNLSGNGLSYVFGRKGDNKAQAAITCLVQCLHETKLAGIVRRVYNNGNAPGMYALVPVIDTNNFVCLSLIGLCYKDDIKYMAFPPSNLKKYECTKVQVDGFKDLIKAMDLTNAYDNTYDDKEAFPFAETVNPTAQYIMDCIEYRALNPGKPLPQPRDDIMMLFKVPSLIEKRSRDCFDKLKNLFVLKKIENIPKNKRKIVPSSDDGNQNPNTPSSDHVDDDMPKIRLPFVKKQKLNEKIGTIDPINDFKMMLNEGKNLTELSHEMSGVIENLVYCNLDGDYCKALETLEYFRTECVKSNAEVYNTWLQKFKSELTERKKTDVTNLINEKKLNFIVKSENNLSTHDNSCINDSEVYEYDTIPNSTELTIPSEVNDLFDDM